MSQLAGPHLRRGLPRGRGRLPADQVAQAQRERILRAMTAAVAELGYTNVRIADVVERARVSRQTFYAQFADREECFLAAHGAGMALILEQLGRWASDRSHDPPMAQLRGAVRAYLGLAAREPEFAQCMLVELAATGPRGLSARRSAHRRIAELMRGWHEQGRRADPGWPAVPPSRYATAVGAVHELLFDAVAAGRGRDALTLQDAAVDAVVTLLEIPGGP